MENREIDGLMERIEYAVSVCEKNGHLSYDQHKDFNDACDIGIQRRLLAKSKT